MKNRYAKLALTILTLLTVCATFAQAALKVRIKDIARVAGPEPIELIGYGLVIGLNGTGDKDLQMTKQTMANFLENFNVSLNTRDIKSKNAAIVIVTATAPAFHTAGSRIDVSVSSLGDASSLRGGKLLMTPLLDPEGRTYALAQGSVTVGGYYVGTGGAGGATVSKNVPTSGIIPTGALLKYSRTGTLHDNGIITLVLNQPDFTTAERMAKEITRSYNCIAVPRDAGNILVEIPPNVLDMDQVTGFIAGIEGLSVAPDTKAKVIVNERTGTIVMGRDVRIAPAVVAHGGLTVSIKSTPVISQPEPFSKGQTKTEEDVTTRTEEEDAKVLAIEEAITVQDLATMLNKLGASTSDLIAILEALSRVGALQMELLTM